MNKVLIYYLRLVQEYFWMKYFFQIFDLIVLKNGKTKIFTKMAILPIFMTSKRPMGQNGAVRFFGGSEGSMSNIAYKNYYLKIPYCL